MSQNEPIKLQPRSDEATSLLSDKRVSLNTTTRNMKIFLNQEKTRFIEIDDHVLDLLTRTAYQSNLLRPDDRTKYLQTNRSHLSCFLDYLCPVLGAQDELSYATRDNILWFLSTGNCFGSISDKQIEAAEGLVKMLSLSYIVCFSMSSIYKCTNNRGAESDFQKLRSLVAKIFNVDANAMPYNNDKVMFVEKFHEFLLFLATKTGVKWEDFSILDNYTNPSTAQDNFFIDKAKEVFPFIFNEEKKITRRNSLASNDAIANHWPQVAENLNNNSWHRDNNLKSKNNEMRDRRGSF